MKILITGGAGFLGHHAAARLLREGHWVAIADNWSRGGSRENLARLIDLGLDDWDHTDVRDAESVRNLIEDKADADAVLHLAAQVAVTTSLDDPRHDFEVNATGTLNVLEAVRTVAKGRPAVVVASTNKVYGDLSHIGVIERAGRWALADDMHGYVGTAAEDVGHRFGIAESEPLNPATPYGISKCAADCYTRDYARTFGLRTAVLRFGCIYGPAQRGTADQGWISHFVRSAAARQPITVYGDGRQVRDVLWVDDAVDAFVRVVEQIDKSWVCGEAFNIGGGPANVLSINDLLHRLADTFGPLDVRHAEARPGDQRCYVSDLRKAERLLGWRPTVGVVEGVEKMIVETKMAGG